MCPKYNKGICEVVGTMPEKIECIDEYYCRRAHYKACSLYLLELLASCRSVSRRPVRAELYYKQGIDL